MKKYLLFFIFIISSFYIKSSHSAAADLSYTRTATGDYEFVLKFYRDCKGQGAPYENCDGTPSGFPAPILSFVSSCSTFNISLTDHSCKDVSEICDTLLDSNFCNLPVNGSQPGVEEHIYKATVTLAACPDWLISWNYCCRNGAILNLQTPGCYSLYNTVTLDNSTRFNNAVEIQNLPILYTCVGTPVNYSFSAIDADGDNLSFSLVDTRGSRVGAVCVPPTSTTVTNIPWVAPSTSSNPFPVAWGFSFNSTNGDMSFTPTSVGQYVVGIEIVERDPISNAVVAISRKDIQFIILNCPTQSFIPYTSGVNFSPTNFTYYACPSQPFCFDVLGTSNVPTSPLTFTYNALSPGMGAATFVTTGTNQDSTFGQFCWNSFIPPSGTFQFTIIAKAQTCPIKTINTYTYTIVFDDTINPTILCRDTTVYLNNQGYVALDTSILMPPGSIFDNCSLANVWYSIDTLRCPDLGVNPIWVYASDGVGNVDSCLSNITVVDTVNPIVSCMDTTVYLNNLGIYTINGSYLDAGSTDNCSATLSVSQSTFNCNDTGINLVWLYATDPSGNVDSCSANVRVIDTVGPVALCKDTTVYLDATGSFTIDSSYINAGSSDACGIVTLSQSTFTCADIGPNSVTMTVTDPSNNTAQCTAIVTVLDTSKANLNCPSDTSIDLLGTCDYTVPDYTDSIIANDNCDSGVLIITQTPAPGTIIDVTNGGQFSQNQRITVFVSDSSGNTDSCSWLLSITCDGEFEIPQFYSPNNDGINDTWHIKGIENYPQSNVKIFNRFGNMVYEMQGYDNSWDGHVNVGEGLTILKSSREKLPDGTYFYLVDVGEDFEPAVGFVHIRR